MASLVEYDSDDVDTAGVSAATKRTGEALPAAAVVLRSDIQPSFRSVNDAGTIDYRTVAQRLNHTFSMGETDAPDSEEAKSTPSAAVSSTIAPFSRVISVESPRHGETQLNPAAPLRPSPSESVLASDALAYRGTKRGVVPGRSDERINVKDRVKHQRLSGQSGIGDDFRTWRSDEEMRLRQHFD